MPEPIRAFILIRTIPGTSQEVVKSRLIRGVKVASSVYGQYDAVLVVEADNLQEIARIVYDIVAQHPNVLHTETLISTFPPGTSEPSD